MEQVPFSSPCRLPLWKARGCVREVVLSGDCRHKVEPSEHCICRNCSQAMSCRGSAMSLSHAHRKPGFLEVFREGGGDPGKRIPGSHLTLTTANPTIPTSLSSALPFPENRPEGTDPVGLMGQMLTHAEAQAGCLGPPCPQTRGCLNHYCPSPHLSFPHTRPVLEGIMPTVPLKVPGVDCSQSLCLHV